MNSHQWVRHISEVTPLPAPPNPPYATGITEDVGGNNFAVYVDDLYFGIRTVVSPRPTTPNVDFTWRYQVARGNIRVIDVEWKYRTDGSSESLQARAWFNGVHGNWVDKTAELSGSPTGEIAFDSVFSTGFSLVSSATLVLEYDPINDVLVQISESLITAPSLYVEDHFVGTASASYEYRVDGSLVDSWTYSQGFDIRALAIKKLKADKAQFNPNSDENTTTIKADIMALPASTSLFPSGWAPASDIEWRLRISDHTMTPTVHQSFSGLESVGSFGIAGKVAEIEQVWDGKNYPGGNFIEGASLVRADADATKSGGGTSLTRLKYAEAICNRCPKGTLGGRILGRQIAAQIASPVGPNPTADLTYQSWNSGRQPASFGYGWSSNATARILPQANLDLVYQSASGGFLRWLYDSGNYTPLFPDNYVEIEVDTGSTDAYYKLTFKDQTVYEFNDVGRLKREVDRNGNAVVYSYGDGITHDMDFLVSIVESGPGGRGLYFDTSRTTDNQPESVRVNDSSAGRQTTFSYYSGSDPDVPNRLYQVTNAQGEVTTYVYWDTGELAAIVDPRDELARYFEYDGFGRVVAEVVYGQMAIVYEYNLTTARFPEEELTIKTMIDLVGSEPNRIMAYALDTRSNITKMYEFLDVSSTTIDDFFTGTGTLDGEKVRTTVFEYTDSNSPYLLTKRTNPNMSSTNFQYNAQGNLKKVIDPKGYETVFEYAEDVDTTPIPDAHRNLLRKVHRPDVTVGGSLITYPPTEFVYDANGNLVEVIEPQGESSPFDLVSTYFERLSNGQVEKVINRKWDGSPSTKNDYTTTFTYKSADDNLESITTPAGPGSVPSRTVEFDYDGYDNLNSVTDDLTNSWSYAFDNIDRPTLITDARGKYVGMHYADGLLDYVEAPENENSGMRRKTYYTYDTPGRVEQIDSDISSSATEMRVRYEFTGFSDLKALVRLKDAVENSVAYTYDQVGRQDSMTDQNSQVHTTTYAPFCVGFEQLSARGILRNYSFEPRCLMTEIEAGAEKHLFEYDELGRMTSSLQGFMYGKGKFGQARYGSRRRYEYDSLDRITRVTFGDGKTIDYSYSRESELLRMVDPNGNATRYEYQNDGLLSKVIIERDSSDVGEFVYSYDAAGRLAEIVYPTDSEIVAKFDDGAMTPGPGWNQNGQLTCLRYEKDGTEILRFEYDYDDSGNRVSMDEKNGTPAQDIRWEYSYDFLNRLTEVKRGVGGATPSAQRTYQYDESDNRKFMDDHGASVSYLYDYDDANQLQEIFSGTFQSRDEGDFTTSVETFAYDDDGNMIESDDGTNTNTFSWDTFDRLVAVERQPADETVLQYYDTGRLRKLKTAADGTETRSHFSGLPTVSEVETPSAGSPVEISYFMGHQLLGFDRGGDFRFFLTDGLSSVRVVVDGADGSQLAYYEHDEFGQQIAYSGSVVSPKTYVGGLGVHDDTADTGLLYMRQRHYDASLGRFLSRDPIGFAGGLNLYNYCINNPVNYVDPSGLVLRIGYDSSTDAGFELLGLLNRYSNLNIKLNPVQEYIARKNGEIEITPEMLGKPGANENELAKQIRAAAASSKGINFDAVSNEPTCFGGLMESTQRQVIDVYDFRQIVRDFPPEIVGGWLTHELTEGFTAQTGNIGYDEGAHKAGLDAENRYLAPFGWRRESDYRRLPYANFERTLPDGSTQKFHMTNAPDALGGTDFQWNPGWLSSP